MGRMTLLLLTLPLLAYAVDDKQVYPFDQYKAPVFRGKPAMPKLESAQAREHRTIITRSVRRGPNFAGHYTVVEWGCGTECAVYVIVDDRTGKVYELPELSKGLNLGLDGPSFRADSKLMVLANCPDPQVYGLKDCKRNSYKWNGSELELLKSGPTH
jgi:hypothetical protein